MQALIAGACALLLATSAAASPEYPERIADELDLPCGPCCRLCHETREGGAATANAPFGIAARRAGLECCDTGQLPGVLAELEAAGTDLDEDGVVDFDELRAFTDPNQPGAVPLECAPDPGCGCSVAPHRASTIIAALALGSAALLVTGRRRRLRR